MNGRELAVHICVNSASLSMFSVEAVNAWGNTVERPPPIVKELVVRVSDVVTILRATQLNDTVTARRE